jgi:hypothetical protein
MKTILAAALLLCCVGTAAHALGHESYKASLWTKEQKQMQCTRIRAMMEIRANNALDLRVSEERDRRLKEAAEWAAIYQAACKD